MKPSSGQAAKIFCILVIAQAACLCLGLWLESQFVGAISQNAGGAERASTVAGNTQMAMRIMAFIWIAALQALVAYLVLSRVNVEALREAHRAADELLQRQSDLVRTRDAVIFGMAKLAEYRDTDTGNHLERIALYATLLAKALRRNPRYREQVSASFVKLIGVSSALHDIGKVGIRDSILLKVGSLTEEERQVMMGHAEIGARCVRDIELRLGRSNFLQMARQIAFCHHERWDGTGYPRGLIGESIPLAARIVAIADVYDALMSRRTYKEPSSHEHCVAVIREGAGTQFDPVLVDVFLRHHNEFRDLAQRGEVSIESDAEPSATRDPGLQNTNDSVVTHFEAIQAPIETTPFTVP